MDENWRFYPGDFPLANGHMGWAKAGSFNFDPISSVYDDSKWRMVNLPHDFVIDGRFIPAEAAVKGELIDPTLASRRLQHTFHGSLAGGVGWYRKAFFLPAEDRAKRLVLEFDGIFGTARYG